MPSTRERIRSSLARNRKARADSTKRLDIQGLRAVAVVAVILDHLLHWPGGGFVGVDVFFVISGFLITGMLVREYETTGRISFTAFYARRVRRIVPASTVVLLVVLVAATLLFNRARAGSTIGDVVFGFLFSANWHFAATGTDYFQSTAPPSPVQHFWSLAVEEQFYFVWPWLMLAVLLLAVGRPGRAGDGVRARRVLGVLMAVLAAGSFGWALHESVASPTVAYFSTFSRAWELGVGALLAIVSPVLSRLPEVLRPLLAWLGLGGILASCFVITTTTTFPAPWAALPVLATALVIAAGTGGRRRFLAPLTGPVTTYLGDISYSLYLWHFPVIVFASDLLPAGTLQFSAICAGITLVVSIASYHLIELPLHQAPVLQRFPGSTARKAAFAAWRRRYGPHYKYGSVGLMAIAVLAIVTTVIVTPGPNATPAAAPPPARSSAPVLEPTAGAVADVDGPEVAALQQKLASAVQATEWPQMDPPLDGEIQNDPYPENYGPCGDVTLLPADECTWGDPDSAKSAILLGDSVAMKLGTGLINALGEGEWHIRILAMFGCPFVDLDTASEDGKAQACAERKAAALTVIAESSPDLVLVENTATPPRLASTNRPASPAEYETGLTSILSKIDGAGHVVLLDAPPSDKDVTQCYTPVSSPADCLGRVRDSWYSMEETLTTSAAAAGVVFVSIEKLFCTEDGLCPAFAGKVPIKRDAVHITPTYANEIMPGLLELLRAEPSLTDLLPAG